MCGISGIVSREKLSDQSKAAIRCVNAAQTHRGPDGAGEFSGDNIFLAMRRLSIIDPNGGWQPLYNEDKSLALIINGEIYNYIELRERLKASGHKFQTDADGEVILHLYEENDADFINHLRGMFAFALWDVKRRRLILARDRMGEKPLYLFERAGEIVFASELKGLLHSGLVPFELDARSVNLYFHFQYVPEPLTPIKGVRKLDAARMLTVDVENWRIEEREYWRMEDAPLIETGEPRELIRAQLEEVSRLIVRSDVPVGVALSGGLDSSIVAAFAARQNKSLCAFSVGYKGRPRNCDERADAADLARHLDLPFYDVELDTESIVEFFPQLNFLRDDPIADYSGFGYHAVMRLARKRGVPVVLQGQGGDELFWGYPQLRTAARENRLKAALARHPISQAIGQSLEFKRPDSRSPRAVLSWAKDFGGARSALQAVQKRRGADADRLILYEVSADFAWAKNHAREFYAARFSEEIKGEDVLQLAHFSGDIDSTDIRLTRLVCDTYLRENGIAQGDRLGMASSVEMRLPLVDYKLVETVIGLRKRNSDSELPPKFWLREAVRDVLPERVFNRPKRGFEPPTLEWHAALFAAYGDSLRGGFLVEFGILSNEGAAKLARGELPAGLTSPLSFKALVLEQWCRQMISQSNAETRTK